MVLSSAIVCDHDRRIADDRRSSFHMIADDRRPYCDLRSAICDPRSYGNQPLDRTWFYLLRSSAITIAGSQTIANLIAICDQRSYGNQPLDIFRALQTSRVLHISMNARSHETIVNYIRSFVRAYVRVSISSGQIRLPNTILPLLCRRSV